MTTREEFKRLLGRSHYGGETDQHVLAAWDAQAAERDALRAEVEALRKNAWHHPACRACASNRVYQPGMTDEQVRAGLEALCGQRFDDEVWDEVASAWHCGIQHLYEILENRGLPVDDVPHVEPTGVPLTAENAARAWVVALADGDVLVADGVGWWQWARDACHDTTEYVLKCGATVLAWRKP